MRGVGGPTSPAYLNLHSVIEGSPVLLQQMNAAAVQGQLAHFAVLPAGAHAGAIYDSSRKAISLKEADLLNGQPDKRLTLTFLLGHETHHALNGAKTGPALSEFGNEVLGVVNSGMPQHDYSSAIQKMLVTNREDEASSHIAGWNAMVSSMRNKNPNMQLDHVAASKVGYVRSHFVDEIQPFVFAAKPGLTLNPDLSITPNAQNVEAMGKHYFDTVANDTKLGPKGNSDYLNYYAAPLVSAACQTEINNPAMAGQLMLDVAGLKLSPALLADNGISLGQAPAPGVRCKYSDTSTPNVDQYFDHTAAPRSSPVTRPAESHPGLHHHHLRPHFDPELDVRQTPPPSLDHPSHPGHGLFNDAQAAMRAHDTKMGRISDQHTDNLAACLAVAACREGLSRINEVELGTDGKKMWAVHGTPGHVHSKVAGATVDGAMMPITQTSLGWTQAHEIAQQWQEALPQSMQQRAAQTEQSQGLAMAR